MSRALFVWLHRWAGLAMAGFLILVGLTGSLLAFWGELNHWLTPELYPGPRAGIELGAATLARRAESLVPQARATTVYLGHPGSVSIGMEAHDGAAPLDFEFIHLDPVDGHELGRVTWHGLPRRKNDIMPFVYGLHMYLAMSGIGDWILGAVALVWTLDCFVGFYLTLPAGGERSRKGFFTRWKPSWLVKLKSSFYRANFDLHRAAGLWLWAMLLVYAWSSVFFTLPNFYTRATQLVLDYDTPVWAQEGTPQNDTRAQMEWEAGQATGERLMAEQARQHSFAIERPLALYNLRDKGLYEYRVRSSRDIGDKAGSTSILFDSRSGELKTLSLPTGHRSGTTLTTWLVELHMANLFGLPYRIFVCAMGLVIAMLSATGVYIWWKKRSARRAHVRRRVARPAPAE
ncbi:MAG: pepSY-associated TM helix domain-containing protein [Methylocystaceae bacterium]|nr:MAG: pepSY-associated TM helix domain-containing protein [Methylocystaceae bacterium]KAF0213158.1 MAG: pepSY-associated TM helix domain-containing [Methylocystaceae bacterium]TXT45241.1 MAG: pepSY-associated TM helix domain-containing protein [Methylocystaceae bacterium]